MPELDSIEENLEENLGDKGKKALTTLRGEVKNLTEQLSKFKDFGDISAEKVQELLALETKIKTETADKDKNYEETKRLLLADHEARLKAAKQETEISKAEVVNVLAQLNQERILTKLETAIAAAGILHESYISLLLNDPKIRGSVQFLTETEGVKQSGVYVVDADGDARLDPDDRKKYYTLAKFIKEEITVQFPHLFKGAVGVGPGMNGSGGKRKTYDPEYYAKLSPEERLSKAREQGL